MGFQTNTVIQTALWIYKPNPALDPAGKEFCINLNQIHYIEATPDHTTVWVYFAQTSSASTPRPYELRGPVAVTFMADLEAFFA